MKQTLQQHFFSVILIALLCPFSYSQHTHIQDNGEALRLDGTNTYQSFYNGNRFNAFIQANNTDMRIINRNSGRLYLATNNTIRTTIDAVGNMGIGTISPAAKLDVVGTTRSSGGIPEFQLFDNASGENRVEGRMRESGNSIFLESLFGDLQLSANNNTIRLLGNKNFDASPNAHVALIENASTGASADVLALKVGLNGNPGSAANFISFYRGDNAGIGRIEGNGSGGVVYGTTGADFAESLPIESSDIKIQKGDVVGVFEGKISHNTDSATDVMVITDRPAILGNQQAENTSDHENVSFIGQVPVKVVGQVEVGDWIIPSGNNDGIAIAVNTKELALTDRIIGRSWEGNQNESIKKVIVAVGLDKSEGLKSIIIKMSEQILSLEQKLMNLEADDTLSKQENNYEVLKK